MLILVMKKKVNEVIMTLFLIEVMLVKENHF